MTAALLSRLSLNETVTNYFAIPSLLRKLNSGLFSSLVDFLICHVTTVRKLKQARIIISDALRQMGANSRYYKIELVIVQDKA